ncbi:hypothetical protein EGT51_12010 [Levilactobacillus suantsaiihabitans]|uniref:Uncharacterized protein n=1 Tax=Levilactobacillus suantsaiihabitans TaxID=2487722 RepID=A0A4Z0J979_9LACO|nr:hypothetical protein EGT51_12010 [Levilactobacillus suantsaiihabitans]
MQKNLYILSAMILMVLLIFEIAKFFSGLVYNHSSGLSILVSLLILLVAGIAIFELIRFFSIKIFSKKHKRE